MSEPTTTHPEAGILVIDADSAGARFIADALQHAGYGGVRVSSDCEGLSDSPGAKPPDLIVLDLRFQEAEGLTLLEILFQHFPSDEFLPVLTIGPASDPSLGVRAVRAGAREHMAWPVDPEDFLARIGALLETRSLCYRLREGKHFAEEQLRNRTRESQDSHLELLERLARVAELRDDPSGGHPGRVGRLAALIAQELSLAAEETRCLLRAAPLHDLGNVGIPDAIIRLEGHFTEEQRQQMREHTALGAYLLHGAENSVLQMAEIIALNHHERWDGLGYPQGLSNVDIPIPARIVAVADALDAMTHPGQYKEPCSIPSALDEIQREAGWQFDPEVVAALIRVHDRQPGMLSITPRAPRRAAV